jgi:hypothetical protein
MMKLKAITFSLTHNHKIPSWLRETNKLNQKRLTGTRLLRSKSNRSVINLNWCCWLVYFVLLQATRISHWPCCQSRTIHCSRDSSKENSPPIGVHDSCGFECWGMSLISRDPWTSAIFLVLTFICTCYATYERVLCWGALFRIIVRPIAWERRSRCSGGAAFSMHPREVNGIH